MQSREESTEHITTHYSTLRLQLSDAERPLFDKAIYLLEEVIKVESDRILILEIALIIGLSAVSLTPKSHKLFMRRLTELITLVLLEDLKVH